MYKLWKKFKDYVRKPWIAALAGLFSFVVGCFGQPIGERVVDKIWPSENEIVISNISELNNGDTVQRTNQYSPYLIKSYPYKDSDNEVQTVLEFKPNKGVWVPFFLAIPIEQYEAREYSISYGPSGVVPTAFGIMGYLETNSTDNKYHIFKYDSSVGNEYSAYLFCSEIPTEVVFGIFNGEPQYSISLRK
jgi:hypothetical protein